MNRSAAAFLFALAAATSAFAADARKYAVLSLMGDRMLVVQYVPMIGGRIDRNVRDYIELEDPVLDKTALLAANQALKSIDAASKPILLFARERVLYEASGKFADGGEASAKLLGLIRPLLQGSGATHLILLTRVRSEARLQLRDVTLGSGMIDGVGFYVDPSTTTQLDNGASGNGFVGAFAYFQVSVIDVAKNAVVAEQRVLGSRTQSAASTSATDAWAGISAQEKMHMLQDLVREEVGKAVPKAVGAAQ